MILNIFTLALLYPFFFSVSFCVSSWLLQLCYLTVVYHMYTALYLFVLCSLLWFTCLISFDPVFSFMCCFTDSFMAVLLLWIICVIYILCLSCFSRLFIAALWSPAENGLMCGLLSVGVVIDCIDT